MQWEEEMAEQARRRQRVVLSAVEEVKGGGFEGGDGGEGENLMPEAWKARWAGWHSKQVRSRCMAAVPPSQPSGSEWKPPVSAHWSLFASKAGPPLVTPTAH